jgi:hypothetical protein
MYITYMNIMTFHATSCLLQRASHDLYKNIDWDRVTSGDEFAVVNPSDRHSILYLSPVDYIALMRTCLSNNVKLITLAEAGASKETVPSSSSSSDNKTPPKPGRQLFASTLLGS